MFLLAVTTEAAISCTSHRREWGCNVARDDEGRQIFSLHTAKERGCREGAKENFLEEKTRR